MRLDRVAFGVNQDSSGHGGGQDHDRVLTEGEPANHGSPVDPCIGHKQNASNRPHSKDRPVPSAIDLGDKDLREQDEQPDEIDLWGSELPEEERVHSILLRTCN